MKTKHTPGPWVFIAWDDNNAVDLDLAVYVDHGDRKTVAYIPDSFENSVAKANGRLIAAAPELKIACEGALSALLLGEHVDKQQAIDYLKEVLAKVGGK